MPVYMKLVMDQKRLPRLLVECANSKMPIEVREVRISSAAAAGAVRSARPAAGRRLAAWAAAASPAAGMGAAAAESSQD